MFEFSGGVDFIDGNLASLAHRCYENLWTRMKLLEGIIKEVELLGDKYGFVIEI